MWRRAKESWPAWLSLFAFVAAGPLEGDEIGVRPGPKGDATVWAAGSTSVAVPQSTNAPAGDKQKDPTVDTGAVKRPKDQVRLVAPSLEPIVHPQMVFMPVIPADARARPPVWAPYPASTIVLLI